MSRRDGGPGGRAVLDTADGGGVPRAARRFTPGVAWDAAAAAGVDPIELPLDVYSLVCGCGEHEVQVVIDMYHHGPERVIDAEGWSLEAGTSPAESLPGNTPCPHCGEPLWTPRAKQCRACRMDWHDPNNVHRRTAGGT